MSRADADAAADLHVLAAALVGRLAERRLTLAVAESLTGGLVAATIVGVPGASEVLNGGIVAYATPLKRDLLGVDAALLAERGAVDAEVARQMADGVRRACAVDGRPADVGLATTGVAGPDPQDGHAPGTVHVAVRVGEASEAVELSLVGGRAEIREAAVRAVISLCLRVVD
ncbi:CinA family protein [Agromyces protaetiae]|uniref:CinA family protein n=1 Tax=Agromyces protaetiae TaxID=2509455 RepID=A0A4P6FK07_9MICO|nr:CinA family protein [Agromyces protaetiae]QAY74317.1 CinA family protein [Agromyces protaetiae]